VREPCDPQVRFLAVRLEGRISALGRQRYDCCVSFKAAPGHERALATVR
jgi:hypothetical protein